MTGTTTPAATDLQVLLLQLNASVAGLNRRLDQLLDVQRRPVGYQPDKLRAHPVHIRRNAQLTPECCLYQWDAETRQPVAGLSNTISLYLSNVRCQAASKDDHRWDELRITGYAGPRVGWVDLICGLGGLTSDALLASLLGMSDEQLRLPVTFSFRPAPQSNSVVLVRVGDHRNDWLNPAPQRAQWGKDSRGMLLALQDNLRRALGVSELPHESYQKANAKAAVRGLPANGLPANAAPPHNGRRHPSPQSSPEPERALDNRNAAG